MLLKQVINQCPDLGDIILRAFMARRQLVRESGTFTGVRVIGSRYSPDTFRIREFLAKNMVLFTWTDIEANPDVDTLLKHFGVTEAETPIVVCPNHVLRNPSNRELAEGAGIRKPLERTVYDLAVVGAGPAGLAAAVYGASEGLNTVVLERTAAGGQAGSSMRIENYLGFPAGLTGSELTERAVIQANKFGAVLSVGTPVTGRDVQRRLLRDRARRRREHRRQIAARGDRRRLSPARGRRLRALRGLRRLLLRDAQRGEAVHGSRRGRRWWRQLRRPGGGVRRQPGAHGLPPHPRRRSVQADVLISCASDRTHAQYRDPAQHDVEHMLGDGQLTTIEVVDRKTGDQAPLNIAALFSFIGAVTADRMAAQRHRDRRSRLRTDGSTVEKLSDGPTRREPFHLETSRRGVFAAGDVRADSVKRVASAVGEGSMAIQFVHEYLKEM